MTDILLEPVCSVCLSSCVSLMNIFTEKQPSTKEPSLVDMISECFNFQLIDDDIHPKNICECCISDVRAAYRFKRNYEQNIKLKENGLDDFIDSLAKENWELDIDIVKKELEDISDDDIAKEIEAQNETNTNSERETDDKTAIKPLKSDKKKKSHSCIFCGKVLMTKRSLCRHFRIHTGERPHKCPHCQKAFSQLWTLKMHLVVHTGERKYKCPQCPKDFTQKHNLDKHMAKCATSQAPKTKTKPKNKKSSIKKLPKLESV